MNALGMNVSLFFAWLLRATLQGSLLVCLILLIKLVLRNRLPARWHYVLWLVLLVRLSLPWAPQSRLSVYNLLERPQWTRPARTVPRNVPVVASESGQQGAPDASRMKPQQTSPEDGAREPSRAGEPPSSGSVRAEPAPIESRRAQWRLPSLRIILPVLWLIGAVILAGYVLIRNVGLWRAVKRERPVTDQQILDALEDGKMQMGVQTIVGLVVTDRIKSPALFGFVRPRILLPEGLLEALSLNDLQYVFLHELAHLKRRDIYLAWLVSLLQILHWFNPLIWFAFRRMRADQEMACDALALSRMTPEEPSAYGRTIVNLLERFSQPHYVPSVAGILEDPGNIERRMTMIAKFKSNSYCWSTPAFIMIMILACISLPDAMRTRASEATASQSASQPEFTKIRIPNRLPWDAQLSPDGKSIAFVNEKKIWIMPGSSRLGPGYPGAPRQLNTGDVPVDSAGFTWSGDGQWIAFTDSRVIKEEGREGNQSIYVVPATGGEPRKVHENNRHSLIVNYRMSLSPNGNTLAFSSFEAHRIYIGTISVDGGSPRRLVDAPAREPVFSPDGQIVAYVENKKLGAAGGGLWTVPADGGTPTLVADANNASSPVWSPDGRMIAFIDLGMGGQIYIVPVAKDGTPGGAKFQVDLPEGTKEAIRLAGWTPDNKIGGVFENKTEFGLYTQPAQGGKAAFLTVGGYPTQPRWFPDGKRVCHTNSIDESSGDWERYALAYVAAEGGEVTTIPIKSKHKITIWGYGTGNRVSPDGTTIVFAGQAAQKNLNLNILNIWTLPIEGGEPGRLTDPPTGLTDWYPCWSHDGRNIAFVREKISDVWAEPEDGNIYVVSSEGGEPRKITWESDRVYSAGPVVWSPSGEWLAFYSRDRDGGDGALCVTSPIGGELKFVAAVANVHANKEMAWSPDSKRIAYLTANNRIKIVSLDDGSIEGIQPDLKDVNIYHLDWSPDGETFVLGGYSGGGPEFWTMENFLPAASAPVAAPASEPTTVRRVGGDWGTFASLSPDGKYLCDVDWKTETLAVLELATGKVRHVTSKSPDDACYPLDSAISPDSREVAYLWWDPNTRASSLHVVGLDGSGHRLLCKGKYPMPRAWSADGKKILAVVSENDVQQMVWVSASDGSMQHIASFDDESLGYPGRFDISPDGRFIAYDRPGSEDAPKRDLFLFDLDKSAAISLVEHPADDRLLGWTPDGRWVLFASDRAGSWDAWLLQVAGGKPQGFPELVKHGIGEVRPIGFTPQGSYYYAHERILNDVFTARLDLDTGEILSEPVPVRQTGATACHDWSPDGGFLAYCERRPDESRVIHIRTLATGRERTLAENLPYIRWLRWSPDGRSILIDGARRGDSQGVIFKLDAQTGERSDLVRSETEVLVRPEMSPDAKTLYYDRNDPRSRTMRLMARDLESDREKELLQINPPARLTGSALSPDGRRLVFSIVPQRRGPGGPVLKTISTAGGQPKELLRFDGSEGLWAVGVIWMPDSQNVLFWKWFLGDKPGELWRVSAEGGEPRRLWVAMDRNVGPGHLRVHPDGQRVAFQGRSTTRGVWVMENFLPKAVAAAGE